ncbi:MAG: response regulator, partial [Terriglobia bacterium]
MCELRILLADDHEVVRKGLRSLLNAHNGWKVIGEASDGRDAVEKAQELKPDIVIMDITMPKLTGLEAARRILQDVPETGLLFFTMHNSEQMVHEALSTGARGYVLKSDSSNDLVKAIESLPQRKMYVSPKLAPLVSSGGPRGRTKASVAKAPDQVLTSREREVLQLLAEGKNSKEVATALGITVKTVETHRSNLMAKLDLHSLPSLVLYAIR